MQNTLKIRFRLMLALYASLTIALCPLLAQGTTSHTADESDASAQGTHVVDEPDDAPQRMRVVLLTAADSLSQEERAALAFLSSTSHPASGSLPVSRFKPSSAEMAGVYWIHLTTPAELAAFRSHALQLKQLRAAIDRGARVLCTGYAAMLPFALGIEPRSPSIRIDTVQNDWLWDKRGFQGFRGHPLFEGMFGGEYVWDPDTDQLLPFIGYMKNEWPGRGRVIGVDKAYVFVYADTKLVIEHTAGKGRMISVGSSIYLAPKNHLRANLEVFLTNALEYLSGKKFQTAPTYWERSDNQPKRFSVRTGGAMPAAPSAARRIGHAPASGLLMGDHTAKNNYYDVAGRRALFMGRENGGIDELWVHPYKVFYQYQAGIVRGDSIAWLKHVPLQIDVRPESFSRTYRLPEGELREVIVSSLDKAGGIVHYESTFPLTLVVRFKSDMRWMWPYDMNALGDLYYAYDSTMSAFHLKDRSGDFYTIVGSDVRASGVIAGQYDSIICTRTGFSGVPGKGNTVASAARYELSEKNERMMNLCVIGTNVGRDAALAEYRAMLSSPLKELTRAVDHYTHLLASTVRIESPDRQFDSLFQWAVVGTDKFYATTPGVGAGLLAGYSTTARGWNGAQKVSGRPGYAWYFGRDAAWSSFAIDDYGNFPMVRTQLEFFERYQDRSGKIFHELSTSGVVHYDASDATPLYVILAGHYLRASGDTAYVRQSWPHLKKAAEFLYSTDTDKDGLIENTNVGHGWVEGGALFGVHTEFYLAALWAQALKDLSLCASVMEEYPLSERYAADAAKVQKMLNAGFWNDSTRFYNFAKFKDGTYLTEKTVVPAVGAYLDLLDDAKMDSMLDAYASNAFSADWGIRIVSSASPMYKPTGYHYGSIWPLFTGWTALGEYEYGNSVQGFMHIWDNLNIKNHWELGYVEEVMHGAIYTPTGICPHQCWSETNILHPAITGMIGWKPNAIDNAAGLRPRFPAQWDTVTVHNLKIGRSTIRYSMKRAQERTAYEFMLESGPPVDINFAPELPAGMTITHAALDGREITVGSGTRRGILSPAVVIGLRGRSELVLQHTGGIAMQPVMPTPAVGDSSQGYRIISTRLSGDRYTIDLEGLSGTTHEFPLRTFNTKIIGVTDGELVQGGTPGEAALRVKFDRTQQGRYSSKEVIIRVQ